MSLGSRTGEKALAFTLNDEDGREIRLDDFSGNWLLMVFHRHLAWLPCREHLSQLWQQKKELECLHIKVIVITFEPLQSVTFQAADAASFPYYVDEERQLYRHYGILNAGFWDLWGPRTWLVYLHLLLKGRKILKSQSDIEQRGGDVLIDPQTIIRYHHIGTGPADRPDSALICDLVRNSS